LPATGFLRQWQVLACIPFSKSTLWRRIQNGTFPQPIKLSERVTVWRVEAIRDWIDAQSLPVESVDLVREPGFGPSASVAGRSAQTRKA